MSARLNSRLFAHVRRVIPQNRLQWADAMEREAGNISENRTALFWTLGCVAVSYGERLRAEHFLLPLMGRLYLACICIAYAMGHFVEAPYPQMLCKLFGSSQPFYPPFPFTVPFASFFVPHYSAGSSCHFMSSAPFWPSVLRLAESGLFLFAALQLIRKRISALTAFALAFLIGWGLLIVWRYGLGSMRHVFPTHDQMHQLLLQVLFGVLYPLIIGTCIALLVDENSVQKAPN